MLYDQAQLVIAYLEAFQITGDAVYANAARRTLDYVRRDLTHPEGGFFSAEDADSASNPAYLHEKSEGAFYIWSRAELERLLGARDAALFSYRFGVEANGNVQHDPHQEFTGRNILFEAHTVEETAEYFGQPVADVATWLDQAAEKLVAIRNTRPRPHLDDKVLTSWNGLMISAFAKGAQVLGQALWTGPPGPGRGSWADTTYTQVARRATDFLKSRLWDEQRGIILRRFRDGESAIDGFLDDYAFFAIALLDLYETSFDAADLQFATRLAERARELFEDADNGGFFSTPAGTTDLVMRLKDDYDGAEPSGNSIMALLLLRVARMTGRDDFRESAERTLKLFSPRLHDQPSGVPQMLVAHWYSLAKPMEIVLAGDFSHSILWRIRERFLPRAIVMRASETSIDMPSIDGKPTVYVCENFACNLPVTDEAHLVDLLK
jgi:uncharacterized protein YyaL (SSP411 family)